MREHNVHFFKEEMLTEDEKNFKNDPQKRQKGQKRQKHQPTFFVY